MYTIRVLELDHADRPVGRRRSRQTSEPVTENEREASQPQPQAEWIADRTRGARGPGVLRRRVLAAARPHIRTPSARASAGASSGVDGHQHTPAGSKIRATRTLLRGMRSTMLDRRSLRARTSVPRRSIRRVTAARLGCLALVVTVLGFAGVAHAQPPPCFALLCGVSAASRTDAWAVGRSGFWHWSGRRWRDVAKAIPARPPEAVAAVSRNDAWAVGSPGYIASRETLIEHWNGHAWREVASPNAGPAGAARDTLAGVAAISSSDAWAVGSYQFRTRTPGRTIAANPTLILRWNGSAWRQVPSPSTGYLSALSGVAAVSPSDAWAVGFSTSNGAFSQASTLIEHWNGSSWTTVPSPNPGSGGNELLGVAATSPTDAWAVGFAGVDSPPNLLACSGLRSGETTILEHWNGTTWTTVPSPNPGGASGLNILSGVTATSPTNAWAVGYYSHRAPNRTLCSERSLVLHWNGVRWQRLHGPRAGLVSVAAISSTRAFAVPGTNIVTIHRQAPQTHVQLKVPRVPAARSSRRCRICFRSDRAQCRPSLMYTSRR